MFAARRNRRDTTLGAVDLRALLETFGRAIEQRGPVLVHVRTQKGRGYRPAETDQVSFHGAALPPMPAASPGRAGVAAASDPNGSQGEAGLAQMHQGLTAVVATGQELARPLCLVPLAEAAGHIGHVEEGLRLLAEALTALEASGQGDLLAEAYRLQGELLRQATPDATQAEACFQQALAIARRQQAKSWELRAVMSLSRLWQQQGKRDAARELLTPLYGWFTEGFDTPDLQEARALLDELA